MLKTPFLTDLDSRAAVKGSRDPLGCQSVWTRFGRRVVGNLSTVSNSIRDFTTLLLGYYFAHRMAEEDGEGNELRAFLKWEQLAAYARAECNNDWSFRGTERVRAFLEDSPQVTLSDAQSFQILGNQKIYGLWGLYTVPARSSELLERDSTRLTPATLDLVENVYMGILKEEGLGHGERILGWLKEGDTTIHVRGKDRRFVHAVARILQRKLLPAEQSFYRTHLLLGGPVDSTEGRQPRLAELIESTLDEGDFTWSPARLRDMAETAAGKGAQWLLLADALERIRHCESVLAPMSMLFNYLLGCDGRSVNFIAQRLQEEWGAGLQTLSLEEVRPLRAEFGGGNPEVADRWVAIAESAASNEYALLMELLIQQSASVMQARGGSPWIEAREGILKVRFRDDRGELPRKEDLPTLWRFPYFLDSMRAVATALKVD